MFSVHNLRAISFFLTFRMKQQDLLENTHTDLPFQVGAIWQITLYTIYYYILQSRTFNVFIEMITSSKKTKNMAKCVTIMVFFSLLGNKD